MPSTMIFTLSLVITCWRLISTSSSRTLSFALTLSKNGIIIVTATVDKKTKKILANPQILTRGFIYVKDHLDLVERMEEISKEVIEENIAPGQKLDFTKIKNKIREKLGDYTLDETGTIPMIITVIEEL